MAAHGGATAHATARLHHGTAVLPADADASWVVVAESTTAPITTVWPGQLAWAATSAIFTDIAADGWTAPLPPLVKL